MFVLNVNILLLIFIGTVQCTTQNLKQLHLLFRHGERSPTSTYPTDPHKDYKWSGGWGHLTNEGKRQMYSLGQNLREYYKSFIPVYYWPGQVNFTSSYADRCQMSAQMLAAGIFPPMEHEIWNPQLLWQPIPIYYLPRSLDNNIAMKRSCATYDEEFANVMKSDKIQSINALNKDMYKFLSNHTGLEVNNIGTVETLFNTLEIERNNNLTLPNWVNDELLIVMKDLGAQNLAIYSQTQSMKRMKGGVFLKTVIDLMKNQRSPLVNLYAGHDLTLVHVMRALNLTDLLKPELGASLVLELDSNSNVKIFYREIWNGSPTEQKLSFCDKPCLLSEFERNLKSLLPDDWEKECSEAKTLY